MSGERPLSSAERHKYRERKRIDQQRCRERRRFGLRPLTIDVPIEATDEVMARALVGRGYAELSDFKDKGLGRILGEWLQDALGL
jgi:hypothetical protein